MKNILLTLCILLLTFATTLAQCPMCKATAMSAQKESGHAFGLNDAILYLLALPLLSIIIIGVVWYKKSLQFKTNPK